MVKKDNPIIYLFIYDLIVKKADRTNFITHRDLMELLKRRLCKIPQKIYYLIIKDLESITFLKRHGNSSNIRYELVGKDAEKIIRKELGSLI